MIFKTAIKNVLKMMPAVSGEDIVEIAEAYPRRAEDPERGIEILKGHDEASERYVAVNKYDNDTGKQHEVKGDLPFQPHPTLFFHNCAPFRPGGKSAVKARRISCAGQPSTDVLTAPKPPIRSPRL